MEIFAFRNVLRKAALDFILVFSITVLPDLGFSQSCNETDRNITATTSELLVLTSPGYNGGTGTYDSNMDCWWLIDAGADDLKLLIFLTYDTSCPGDKVYIYDGTDNTDAVLANGVCGAPSSPSHYSTKQRYARVELASDGAVEKAGFKIEFVAAKDYSGTGCAATQTLTSTDGYQFLSGSNFPGTYASDSNCRWAITNPDGGNLVFDVIVSDIEDDDPTACDYDKYMIYDGPHRCDNNNIQMVCSEHPKVKSYNFTSNESVVTVTLHSDSSINRRGFLLRFKSGTSPATTTTITTSAVSQSTAKPKGLEMTVELLLGIVFGSLILILFTLVTVVIVAKKVRPPVSKTITPVQPYRQKATVQTSIRPRRQNENGNTDLKVNGMREDNGKRSTRNSIHRTMSVW